MTQDVVKSLKQLGAQIKLVVKDGAIPAGSRDAKPCFDGAKEIERLRTNIVEAESLLTIAVVPDGHNRCEMALKALRRNLKD